MRAWTLHLCARVGIATKIIPRPSAKHGHSDGLARQPAPPRLPELAEGLDE